MHRIKFNPMFISAVGKAKVVLNKPIFSDSKGITKKAGDINDLSRVKHTFTRKELGAILDKRHYTKHAKSIRSRTKQINENKWMWQMMKRARQL